MGLVHRVSDRLSSGVWAPYHGFHTSEYHHDKNKNTPKVWTLLDWIVYSESPWAIVWTLYVWTLNYQADFKVLFCFYSLVHVFLFVFWNKYMPLQENMRFASWTGFKLALPGLCLILWSFGCLPSWLALTGMTWLF